MKISVLGATGAMGGRVIKSALQSGHYVENKVASSDDISCLFSNTDVVIDFSSSIATERMLLYVKKHMPNIPIVIGTTGLSKIHIDLMENCSYFTPIFHAPNMSFVVSLINTLLALVAKILPSQEFDTEISEVHHKLKKDAPSGTALMFGKTIAEVRGDNFLDVANFIRYGIIDQRKTGEIGFSVQRCGRVIGKHKVSFVGNHENISIIHEAHSKEIYAVGAIHAAEWTYKQKPGLYDMRDLTKDAVLPIIKEMCEDLE